MYAGDPEEYMKNYARICSDRFSNMKFVIGVDPAIPGEDKCVTVPSASPMRDAPATPTSLPHEAQATKTEP